VLDEYIDNVLDLDRHDIDQNEWELLNSQYTYIKFGLILERFRNESWWNRCKEKFTDFKNFCQSKVNITTWQANDAIKSAHSALRLARMGYSQLPRNASQALALATLSLDRACEVWENICDKFAPHKITAAVIKHEINPDAQPLKAQITLPTVLIDRIHHDAALAGLTVGEYLAGLVTGEDTSPEPPQSQGEITDEQIEALDNLDRQFKAIEPKKIIEATVDSFDRLMNDLIGKFIPSVHRRVANE
jgi:hypothetical protein